MNGPFDKSTDFVQRNIAGECLLIPIRRRLADANSLYVLNETGAAIWERLDGTRTLQEITGDLLHDYEVPPEQLEQDVQELVNDLLSIQAIHPVHR